MLPLPTPPPFLTLYKYAQFLKKSWGAIYDGSKYLRKEIKDPRQASRAWEEAVGEATSVIDDND